MEDDKSLRNWVLEDESTQVLNAQIVFKNN